MMNHYHYCSIIPPLTVVFLGCGCLFYFLDTVTDLRVSYYMYHDDDELWGLVLLCISVSSFFISNGMSLSKRHDRKTFFLPKRRESLFDITTCKKNSLQGYFCPWSWNKWQHIWLNVLSMLQLNPIIDMIELIFHKKQCIRSITLKYAHYKATEKINKVLANPTIVTFQTLSLVRFIEDQNGDVINQAQFYFRVISVVISCISMTYSTATEERARRFADFYENDFTMNHYTQTMILFVGYFLIFVSRVLLIAVIFDHFLSNVSYLSAHVYSFAIVECHHLAIFAIYLIYSYKSNLFDDTVIEKRRPFWVILPLLYLFAVMEIFMINLRFPVRTIGLILKRDPQNALGTRGKLMFLCMYCLFGSELLVGYFLFIYRVDDKGKSFVHLSYVSIVMFVLSAVMFAIYFHKKINPDERKEKFIHKAYLQSSLIPITCDVALEELPSLECAVRKSFDVNNSDSDIPDLPAHFAEYILADKDKIIEDEKLFM